MAGLLTFYDWGLGVGDWGLGIGDWGLGVGEKPGDSNRGYTGETHRGRGLIVGWVKGAGIIFMVDEA